MFKETVFSFSDSAFPKNATIIADPDVPCRGVLIYLHGGGLLYGTRDDLPELHKTMFTERGFAVIAVDYPFAPLATIKEILADIASSVNAYLAGEIPPFDGSLPYFLFGRSSGAYLSMMTALDPSLARKPAGVLSYYGYGFLTDFWYNQPAPYYRALPPVPESIFKTLPKELHCEGPLESHYSAYVYARQTGKWLSLIFPDREKYFYASYSLRPVFHYPVPLFTAHASGDPDVPFTEYLSLVERYDPVRFVFAGAKHDFDRNTAHPDTTNLLRKSLGFLEKNI